MSKTQLSIVTALLLTACASPFQVRRIPPDNTGIPANSVLYALPRASLVAEIPVTREHRGKATCTAALAAAGNLEERERFNTALTPHGLNNIGELITNLGVGGERYEYAPTPDLLPAITIVAEPDPDAVFAVDIGSERAKKKTLALTLSDLGVVEAVNMTAEDSTTEVVVEVVTTVVTIVASVAALLDQDPASELERCRLKLKQLDDLEKRRVNILKNLESTTAKTRIPHDAAAMLLGEIKAEKDKLLDPFRGIVVAKENVKIRCEVTPTVNGSEWKLLTINAGGVIAEKECQIPESWKSNAPAAAAGAESVQVYTLLLETREKDAMLDAARRSENIYDTTMNKPSGLVYRAPARARVKLRHLRTDARATTTAIVAAVDALIPQRGVLLSLPRSAEIKNAKATFGVTLHPVSGAPKEIKVEYGTATVPDMSGVADKAAPLIERTGTQKRLEKEKTELELEKQIFELQCAKAKREGVVREGCDEPK